MNLAQKVRVVTCLSMVLLAAVAAQAQSGPLKDEIAQHEQMLEAARDAKSFHEEATELNILGFLYRQAGLMQKALDYLNQALTIEQKGNNHAAQAMTQGAMGRVYTDLGQEDKALELFNQALTVWRSMGIKQAEASR